MLSGREYKMELAVEKWKEMLEIQEVDVRNYSGLALAYIGDNVYELCIRTVLISRGQCPVDRLNREASFYAKAVTQAKMILSIMDRLTEEEQRVYKRGRNATSPTKAKNATVTEYRTATGFEAVIGYLYLTGQFDRMIEIVRMAFDTAGMYREEETYGYSGKK